MPALDPTPSPNASPLPAYFIGHAGVGLLWTVNPDNPVIQANLRQIGKEIQAISPRPKAIITFSGHFEAGEILGPGAIEVNVKDGTYIQHDFVNDFHDTFPTAYKFDWPHHDDPELAKDVWNHLNKAGIRALRVERGVDHGIWVPFKVMFPPEDPLDLPVVQVSTYHGYDLASQIRLGEAVHSLRSQGYLIIGSGMAVHSFASLHEIREAPTEEDREVLQAKCLSETRDLDTNIRNAVKHLEASKRREALLKLESLPEFRRGHPTVEHFTPLLVVAGAAGDAKEIDAVGVDVVQPAFSYLNFRFK